MADQFLPLDEFRALAEPVVRAYLFALRRPPDYSGLVYWMRRAHALGSLAAVLREFAAADPQFQQRLTAGTDVEFIRDLYAEILRRPADAAGCEHWLAQFAGGSLDRAGLFATIMATGEALAVAAPQDAIIAIFAGLVSRVPTEDELAYWTQQFEQRAGTDPLVATLIESPEYLRAAA